MKLLLIGVLCLVALASGQYFSAPNYDLNENRNVLFSGFRSLGQPRFRIIDPSLLNAQDEESSNASPQNPVVKQPTNDKRPGDLANIFNPSPFSGSFSSGQFGEPYGSHPGNAIRNIRIIIDPSLLEQLQNPSQGTPNQQLPPNLANPNQPNQGNPPSQAKPPQAKQPASNPKNKNPPKPSANMPNPEPNNVPNALPPNAGFLPFVNLPNGYRFAIIDPSLINPALLNPAVIPSQQPPPSPTTPKAPETTTAPASSPQTATADVEPENNPTTENSAGELPEESTTVGANDDNPLNQPRKASKSETEKPMAQPRKSSKPVQQISSNSPKAKRMICNEE